MKYLICIALCGGVALFGTSCNRSYSCTCMYTENGQRKVMATDDIKGSKNHALNECCSVREGQLTTATRTNVECSVPI